MDVKEIKCIYFNLKTGWCKVKTPSSKCVKLINRECSLEEHQTQKVRDRIITKHE